MPKARRHTQLTSFWSIGRLVAVVALWLLTVHPLAAWGPIGHDIVNTWAIQTLPSEMRGFFEANRQFLVEHANDPDAWMTKDRYERTRHYIYLDKYGIFPFLGLPHSFKQAVEQYGSGRVNRDGVLPWQVGEQPPLNGGVQVSQLGPGEAGGGRTGPLRGGRPRSVSCDPEF